MVESFGKAACEFLEGKISIDEARERIENVIAANTYNNLMEIAKYVTEKMNKIDDYYVVSEVEYNILKATGQLDNDKMYAVIPGGINPAEV